MKRIATRLGAAGLLLGAAALVMVPARSAPEATQKVSNGMATTISQMNDPKFLINALDQRVTELEKKLATAQAQLAASQKQLVAHTHGYHAPQCNEFVSLLNMQDAINHPDRHAGMGVCLLRPSVSGTTESQTSPAK